MKCGMKTHQKNIPFLRHVDFPFGCQFACIIFLLFVAFSSLPVVRYGNLMGKTKIEFKMVFVIHEHYLIGFYIIIYMTIVLPTKWQQIYYRKRKKKDRKNYLLSNHQMRWRRACGRNLMKMGISIKRWSNMNDAKNPN